MQQPVTLCKVGGSTFLPVPPIFLRQLQLKAGEKVELELSDNSLLVKPVKKSYTMAELLAASDYSRPQSSEDREWVDAPAVGRELI